MSTACESPGLAEQLRLTCNLSNAMDDQVLLEIAREVDNHEQYLFGTKVPGQGITIPLAPAVASQISDRRAKLLGMLYDKLADRDERMSQDKATKMAANLIRVLVDTLIEMGNSRTDVQIVVAKVVDKLDKESPNKVTRQRRTET